MPLPPFDLVWDKLLSILLPGLVVSALVGFLALRWKLAGLAVLAGVVAANVREPALPWLEWDRELGRILLILLLSLVTMALTGQKVWQLLAGMALVGLLSTALFFHDDIPIGHLIGGAVISMLLYNVVSLAEQKLMPWNLTGLLSLTGLALAIVMIHAHSARLSDIGLMWMASCGGLLCVTLFIKGEVRGLAGLSATLIPFLLYYGQTSTESQVPWASFVLIAVAPLTCLIAWFVQNPKRVWIITVLWVTLLALAVGLAMRYETVVLE